MHVLVGDALIAVLRRPTGRLVLVRLLLLLLLLAPVGMSPRSTTVTLRLGAFFLR